MGRAEVYEQKGDPIQFFWRKIGRSPAEEVEVPERLVEGGLDEFLPGEVGGPRFIQVT